MACLMCSAVNGSLRKLETDMDMDILKKIAFVLPDLAMPNSEDPVFACAACVEDVTVFYDMKITSLGNYCQLNNYKSTLEGDNDVKFNELNIVIACHEISPKRNRDTELKINTNCQDSLASEDDVQFTEEDSNLSDGEEPQQSSSKDRRLKCSDCDKAFKWPSQLELHIRVHTGEKPFKCTRCPRTFSSSGNLNQHNLIHTGKKLHECDVYQKHLAAGYLKYHKQNHSNVRPHKCAECSKTFTRSGHLTAHMLKYTGEKPHQCHLCQYKCTRDNSNLSDGEESKQSLSKKRQFKCRVCDKTFSRPRYLKIHSRVHTGERPYKCSTCQKTFPSSGNLKQHKIIHTGEKPHECDVCHKTFNCNNNLKRHKKSHSNVRPYQCRVCNKTFTQSSHLTIHMRTHTGHKPHQCHDCQYKCSAVGSLRRHMRIHTGDKPYICNLCKKSFTQSSNLKVHTRQLHNNKQLN